jgi:hypothetical protein
MLKALQGGPAVTPLRLAVPSAAEDVPPWLSRVDALLIFDLVETGSS